MADDDERLTSGRTGRAPTRQARRRPTDRGRPADRGRPTARQAARRPRRRRPTRGGGPPRGRSAATGRSGGRPRRRQARRRPTRAAAGRYGDRPPASDRWDDRPQATVTGARRSAIRRRGRIGRHARRATDGRPQPAVRRRPVMAIGRPRPVPGDRPPGPPPGDRARRPSRPEARPFAIARPATPGRARRPRRRRAAGPRRARARRGTGSDRRRWPLAAATPGGPCPPRCSPRTRRSWPAGDRSRRRSPRDARPAAARRPGAPGRARPARPPCHHVAHPRRGGRGRHAHGHQRLRWPPGRGARRGAAPLGHARRCPRAGQRRAASRRSCSCSTISRTPRTWAPCCARPRPAASTASSSRPVRSAPLSPAAVKTSAGRDRAPPAGARWTTCRAGSSTCTPAGVRIVGADGDAPLTVREVDLRGPLAIVIGSEGRGLNRQGAPARRRHGAHPHARPRRLAERVGGGLGLPLRGRRPALGRARPRRAHRAAEPRRAEERSSWPIRGCSVDAERCPEPSRGRRCRSRRACPARTHGAADAEAPIIGATRRADGRPIELTRAAAEPEPVEGCAGMPPLAGQTIPALPFCVAADVAQLVEQRFCKPPVPGSSPVVGSNNRGRCAPPHHRDFGLRGEHGVPWVG